MRIHGYRYNNLETQSSVEIIIDLGSYKNEFEFSKIKNTSSYYQYLVIEPNKSVKPKNIYGISSGYNLTTTESTNTKNKIENINNFQNMFVNDKSNVKYNAISVYNMLEELRTTKVIDQENNSYTVYKYYFMGETFVNEESGLIETVKFTLVKDKNF